MSQNHISHHGIIKEIHQDSIDVLIISESACSICKTKHLCGVSDSKEKIITVRKPLQQFEPGENVEVMMSQSMGTMAVLFAYILPFVVMISLMIAEYYSGVSEPVMGLSVVLFLVAYFFTLFTFRKKLNRKFSFSIKKR